MRQVSFSLMLYFIRNISVKDGYNLTLNIYSHQAVKYAAL